MSKWLVAVTLVFLSVIGLHQLAQTGEAGEDALFLPFITVALPLPTIHYFQANVGEADPGETIELQWDTAQATAVTIYHLLPTGQLGQFWSVAASGTMTYTISPLRRNQDSFVLYAANEANQWVDAFLHIALTCPDTWFFTPAPAICAAGSPIVSSGAEQLFEHGVMLWVQGQDLIYVLFADEQVAAWQVFVDEWQDGDAEIDPTIVPPPGYYQPERGFGLVWREGADVRERLGWAVAEEAGYETAIQSTSYAEYNDLYIRAADGHTWRLLPERSGWEKIFSTP